MYGKISRYMYIYMEEYKFKSNSSFTWCKGVDLNSSGPQVQQSRGSTGQVRRRGQCKGPRPGNGQGATQANQAKVTAPANQCFTTMGSSCTACILRTQKLGYSPK